ncbi:MAG: DNA alkylation repair protein [Candidatus Limnocylindrales bacterium]
MTLTFDETMVALEAAGSEQTRKTYLRHGAGEPLFGVKFGDLRPLARKIGTDHALAERLWASGNVDARLLACMVADPGAVSEAELDAWLGDIDTYFLVDTFVAEIASKVPDRLARAERWIASDRDRTAQAGWDLMNLVALSDEDVADEYFEAQLALIAERIEGYGNWTRRSASNTITGIGLRSDGLEASARRTAAAMGPIEFDPGRTACVMPDPIAYLEKTKAHRARQAQKRAGKARG